MDLTYPANLDIHEFRADKPIDRKNLWKVTVWHKQYRCEAYFTSLKAYNFQSFLRSVYMTRGFDPFELLNIWIRWVCQIPQPLLAPMSYDILSHMFYLYVRGLRNRLSFDLVGIDIYRRRRHCSYHLIFVKWVFLCRF